MYKTTGARGSEEDTPNSLKPVLRYLLWRVLHNDYMQIWVLPGQLGKHQNLFGRERAPAVPRKGDNARPALQRGCSGRLLAHLRHSMWGGRAPGNQAPYSVPEGSHGDTRASARSVSEAAMVAGGDRQECVCGWSIWQSHMYRRG